MSSISKLLRVMMGSGLVASCLMLAACGGGGGGGGEGASGSAVSARVAPGANNGAGIVNMFNVGNVAVEVEVDGASSSNDTITVTIRDAIGDAFAIGTGAAPQGAGTALIAPIDVSGLLDGTLTIGVEINSAAGSSGEVVIASAFKDATPPVTPSALTVVFIDNPLNPQLEKSTGVTNLINLQNVGATEILITFPSGSDASDVATLTLDDTVTTLTFGGLTPPPAGGNVAVTGIDSTQLADGSVRLGCTVIDTAGNVASLNSVAGVKDTTVASPSAVFVAAGPGNAQDFINGASVSTVIVTALMPLGPDETIQVQATVQGGAVSVTTTLEPVRDVQVTFPSFDGMALPDGSININLAITDDHDNSIPFAGNVALKDIVAGTVTAANVAAGANNAVDIINLASRAAVFTDVSLSPETVAGDSVTLRFTDIASAFVTLTVQATGPGPATIGPANLSSLQDGAIQITTQMSDPAGNSTIGATGSATQDTVPPATPGTPMLPATASCPANTVNASKVNASVLQTTLAGADAGRVLSLMISNGTSTSKQFFPADNGGAYASAPYALGAFADGPLTLTASCVDAAGNPSAPATAAAIKDTDIQTATSATIPAGPQNALDTIAMRNVSSVPFVVVFPASSQGDTAAMFLDDGAQRVAFASATIPSGGVLNVTVDASSLTDGGITLSGTVFDTAGNSAVIGPFGFAKDTTLPTPPTGATVAATVSSALNEINVTNAPSVSVDVVWPAQADAADSARVVLVDSASGSVTTGFQLVQPGVTVAYAGINASGLQDGTIQLWVEMADAAGNALTAFAGSAMKDAQPPASLMDAHVLAGASNPIDFINAASQATVSVQVTFNAGSVSTDQVTISLGVGGLGVTAGPLAAPQGAGSITFTGIDASSLADGTVTVSVQITDAFQNSSTGMGTNATKDTSAPAAMTSAQVVPTPGANNPANTINAQSRTDVRVDVVVPASYTGTETMFVTLGGSVTSPTTTAPAGGGLVSFSGIDVSALADGIITLQVTVADPAQNQASFAGTSALMDTVAPPVATSVVVVGTIGALNPATTINAQNAPAVSLQIQLAAPTSPLDSVNLNLADASTHAVSVTVVPPAPTSTIAMNGIDTSTFDDGSLSATVTTTDAAGNTATIVFNTIVKDTVAPTAILALAIPAGAMNPANAICGANLNPCTVTLQTSASTVAADRFVITVTDGTTPIVIPTFNGITGAGSTPQTFDATPLAESAITLSATCQDDAGNTNSFAGTPATKDTVPPAVPTSAVVPDGASAGGSNPAGMINASTQGSVSVTVTFPASYTGGEIATIDLQDSLSGTAASPVQITVPAGGGAVTADGLVASFLLDGAISLLVSVADPCGNTLPSTAVGAATKDTTAPSAPTSASVTASAGVNPAGYINTASANAVNVLVNYSAALAANDQVLVTLSSGASQASSATFTAAGGETFGNFTINALAIPDGTIAVAVTMSDAAQNPATTAGTSAIKDTQAPAAPTAGVSAGASNAANAINSASVGAVNVTFTFASPPTTEALTLSLSLFDGSTSVPVVAGYSVPIGTNSYSPAPVNAGALVDGTITLPGTLTDAAGNATSFAGTPATKDTVPPAVPTSAVVPDGASAGGSNPAGMINASTQGSVSVTVTFPASYTGGEIATIDLQDSLSGTAASPVQITVPAGGGAVTADGLVASFLLDGAISLLVSVTDSFGNTLPSTAVGAATKDTTAPSAPTSASVTASAGVNPAGYINTASANAVNVLVNYSAALAANDQVLVTLSNGASQASSATFTAAGGETFGNFTINAQAIPDGTIAVAVTMSDAAQNPATTAGTSAIKDTQAPAAPTAGVSAGASNAANAINAASAGAVSVTFTFANPPTTEALTLSLSLFDGSTSVPVVAGYSVPIGTNSYSPVPVNAGALVDGTITLPGTLTDAAGNATSFAGTPATKDVLPPVLPIGAGVIAGTSNPVNVINSASVSGVVLHVTWDASAEPTSTFTVSLTGGATVISGSASTTPSSVMTVGGLNASALSEGAVTVVVTVTDAAGNPAGFNGTAATKDTTAPAAPSSALVLAGAGNAANFINASSQAAVDGQVNLSVALIAGEQVQFTLISGASQVSGTPFVATGGETTVPFTGINATSLPDGPVTVSAVVTDVNLNSTNFVGTAATKDTVAPAAPSFAGIAATSGNPANYVNIVSQTAVRVQLTFVASSLGSDQVTLTITDSLSAVRNYGPTGATNGAGNLIFVNQDFSTLADGALTVTVLLQDAAGNQTSYPGNSATKDTSPPSTPSGSVSVAAGATNPANMINASTASAVQVTIGFAPAATAGDELTIELSNGASQVTYPYSVTITGLVGIVYQGIDASAIPDGTATLTLTMTEISGNSITVFGTPATKDTVVPPAPSSTTIPANAGGNPLNFVTTFNLNSVVVTMSIPSFTAGDQVGFTLTGSSSTSSATLAVAASLTFPGLDLTGWTDGTILLAGTIADPAGNSTAFPAVFTMDTTPPDAPSLTEIVAGSGNGAGWISGNSTSSTQFRITLPANYAGTETVSVDVTSAATTLSSSSSTAPAGGGPVSFSFATTALPDGAVIVMTVTRDVNNNLASYPFGGFEKDTVAPVSPTNATITQGSANTTNYISQVSQTATIIMLDLGAGSTANDVTAVRLTSGATVTSGEVPGTAGPGGVVTAPFDTSALSDGAVVLQFVMRDLAGNTIVHAGPARVKDTVPSTDPVVDPVVTPTNDASQNIHGVVTPGDSIEISGGTGPGSGLIDAIGTFSWTLPLPADTVASLLVKSVDPAGNRSAGASVAWNASALLITHSSTAPDAPFVDATSGSGLVVSSNVAGGGFVDVDNDGDLDLFVGATGSLYRNNGAGAYTDVTAATGALFVSNRAAIWADYDNDGDLDLFLTHSTLGSYLWKNEFIPSGFLTFSDATLGSSAGLGGTLHGASFFDYDRDGFVDVVVADNDGFGNELLKNDGTGSFSDIFGSGLDPTISDANWLIAGDVNNDNIADVFVGDASPSLLYRGASNASFAQNNGGISAAMSSARGGMAMADLDNDGDQDIVITRSGAANVNQFWMNDGTGVFTESAALAGIATDVQAWDVVLGDFDNDGKTDIYFACNGPNALYLNLGDTNADNVPEFSNVAAQTGCQVNDGGDGRLACAGDIDGDGDLDVWIGNAASSNVLYRNAINSSNYLKVHVVGKGGAAAGSSKDGVGAKVALLDVVSNTIVRTRWVNGGRGAGSQDPNVVHFGGIVPSRLFNVTVTFPSGIVTSTTMVVPATLPSQSLTIVEP